MLAVNFIMVSALLKRVAGMNVKSCVVSPNLFLSSQSSFLCNIQCCYSDKLHISNVMGRQMPRKGQTR